MKRRESSPPDTYWTEVAEWDWLIFNSTWSHLHAPADDVILRRDAVECGGTECGRSGELAVPGLFSRDAKHGLPRCLQCCRRTGMPPGLGSPKNGSKRCRAIAALRIQKRADDAKSARRAHQ